MARFRFSHRAEADLFNIGLYTFRSWGEIQTDRYIRLGLILNKSSSVGAEAELADRELPLEELAAAIVGEAG